MDWSNLQIIVTEPLPAKCVVPVLHHTSNWDFPVGLSIRPIIETDIHYVGKDSLFRWPYGKLFSALGGVPVDRSKSNNFVDAVAAVFPRREVFRLCLAPEGTRSKVDHLKTGFYYIALQAKVPLVYCAFDWGHGEIRFSAPYWPTGDKEQDFEHFYDYFRGTEGYHPELDFDIPPPKN
ncbi:MAG: 1-acyl-sn-glycerol-3-phosphate acyltransferase [Bacteroidota bacterium]